MDLKDKLDNLLINNKVIVIVIALVIIYVFLIMCKISKISIKNILKNHLKSLREGEKKTIKKSEVILFFGFPIILAYIFNLYMDKQFYKEILNVIINVFAIFSGLLLNFLVLAIERKENAKISKEKKEVLEELYNNISFEIFVSIAIVILSLFIIFTGISASTLLNIMFYIIIYSIIVFLLTFFMVLKRAYILIKSEKP